ncbi:MAG: hypothetical protein ISN29_11265 [Gammaproteobacteria bacterium AqS3]|nr:hypothetical protein [Gammaproteobacteria bacterium AqS3]
MKNLKAFSRADVPFPGETRIEPRKSPHQPPPFASLSKHLLSAGALLLLLGLAISAPMQAQNKKLNVSRATLELHEGGSASSAGTYRTLKINPKFVPEQDLTVRLASDNDSIMFFSGSGPAAKTLSLTFSPSNKKAAKEVKVYATEDENNTDETATITISADGVTSETVAVSLLDAGAKLIIVPSGPIDVTEGAEPKTFKIKLNSEPAAGRKIRFKKANEKSKYRIKIDGKTDKKVVLTLSKAELKDGKDISVSAVLDNDTEGGTVEITPQLQKIANGKVAWKQATESEISVNVQDDSNIKLSVSKASLKLAEGGSGTFTVKLASQPSADVTVTLAQPGTANADVTLDDTDTNMAGRQNTLTFTTANWSAAQTVKVRAAQDADNSDDTATIKLTGAGVTTFLMKVSVADDDEDAAGLILSADSLTVEEGGNGSFTVKLATQPTGDVTVSIAQTGMTNSDVTTNPTSLTFTTGNWGDTQTVTVFGGKDSDATDDKATLRVSASGGGYGSVADKEVKVTVKDAAGLKVSKTSLTFSENSSGTFTVRLATAPIGTVTVSITQPNDSNADVTVDTDSLTTGNQNTLTFTTGDWGTVQTVTVNGAEDDDGIDDSATLRVSAGGGGYGSVDHKKVEVTVEDNDTPALTVSATSLTVNEAATGTFTVALATKPSASVTISITQPNNSNADVTTTPASLTFTTGNWKATQTVTVNAAEDDDGGNDSATLQLSARNGGYDDVDAVDVSVTVTDNDTPALTVSPTSLRLTVAEGSNATFTVKLATRPSADVTVSIAQTGTTNGDVTLTQSSLTFTTGNWNTTQEVRVNGAEDADGIDDRVTLQLSARNGGYDDVDAVNVSVTVTDNDRGLTVSKTSLTIDEGSSDTFTVALATQPSASVTVNITQPDDANADVTTTPASLTFTTDNWGTAQTVTVNGAEDDDGIDDSATLRVSAAGGSYDDVDDREVEVTVTENDTPGLTVSKTTLTVGEGSNGAFTVNLDTQPSGNVTVSITQKTGTANSDVTTTQTSLTFTTGNWRAAQTVTVNAAEDADGIVDTTTLVVGATGGGYGSVAAREVEVTVTENDTAGLMVSKTTLTVDENSSDSFTVQLATQPSASVTVSITRPENPNADVTTTPASLTFTTGNWNTAQTVTVSAADDADIADDRATINLRAAGGDYAGKTGRVTVTVHDDDAKLVLSTSSLEIDEEQSGTFTVKLKTRPSASVTVRLAQPENTDVTVDTNTGADGNQNTLTFTTDNWDNAQTVTVKTAHDDDIAQDTATISLTASGGGYGRATGSVQVTVNDNDAVLDTSESLLTINEGQRGTFTVKLKGQPSASVTVTLRQPENTDVTVDTNTGADGNQNTLTFTTDNWNKAQTVRVSTKQDPDAVADIGKIMLSASGAEYGSATGLVKVMVTDDDDAKLDLSKTNLSVNEGQSNTFSVKLKTQPSADVTVTLEQPSGTANPDVTITKPSPVNNQSTLSFTPSNWNTTQDVEVNAAQDPDTVQDTATIKLTASGGDYGGKTKSVSVSVTDDDNAALILSTSSVTVAEGGSGRFTVRLATKPASNVTVTLNPPSNTDVTIVDTDPSTAGTQNTLTFTPSNWNADQTVTVNAAEDDDAITDSATINLTASGADYGEVTGEVTVNVTETDTAGLVVEGSPVTVPEGGSNTFTIKLSSKPSGNVTVSLSQKNDDDSPDVSFDANVSTARTETSLEFTPGNWNTARTVKVNAAEDNDAIEDRLTIRLKASDADYTGKTADVPVTVTENDAPGLMLSKTVLTMDEGESDTFTVRLATQPSGSVTVRLARSGDTDVTRTPTSLTFTASNWSQTQTVTVSAEEDADARMDEATINLTASGADYGSVTGSVAVKVADDDAVALTLSDTSWTMTEGTSRTFTVRLAVNPGGARTVSLASTNTDVTVSPVVLNFTSNDATTAKTVTVSAAQDNDKVDDTAMINLTGTGIRTKSVSVKVLDDDLELVLSTDELCVTEGTSENFTVRLASRPVNSRTVNLTFSESNPDVTADTKPRKSGNQTTLTFTSDNWSTAQAVTVSAAEDDDEQDESAKLRLSGAGLQTGEVEIEVIDDDGNDAELRFVLTPSLVTLTEQGRSETFKVRLNLPPGTDRSVNLIANDNSDVRFVGATSLTFTDFNWRKDRTVTIKAIGDIDSADEEETVKVKSAGIPTGQVTVEITDDDNNSLEIIISGETKQKVPMTINEGSSGTFDVYLSAPPVNGSTVEVRVECFNNNDIWLSHARLNFTNSNWDIPITVRFSAANDTDENDDMADIDLRSSGLTTKWVKATIIDDDYDPLSPPDETPTNCRMPNGQTCPIRDPGVEIR